MTHRDTTLVIKYLISITKSKALNIVNSTLIRLANPQANNMVESFNGRICSLLKQTVFASSIGRADTLKHYFRWYNYHIPKKNIGHLTSIAKNDI